MEESGNSSRREYMKEWRAKKKADAAFVEKRKEYLKEWRKTNAAKCADYMKVYRLTHPEYTEKEKCFLPINMGLSNRIGTPTYIDLIVCNSTLKKGDFFTTCSTYIPLTISQCLRPT